jgi:hypothetical protein
VSIAAAIPANLPRGGLERGARFGAGLAVVARAKSEAVEKALADHAEKSSEAEKYRYALARLGWSFGAAFTQSDEDA